MSDESAERLLSLAHPLLVSPDEGMGDEKRPLCPIPFPEVNLNWSGFTISHLPLLGFKVPKRNSTESERLSRRQLRRIELVYTHERAHESLANTPFSLFKKSCIVGFYEMIFEIFGEEVEQVPVPVTPDRSGNTLQKQCDILDKLQRASMLIEEVFAVHTSLEIALREGLIRNDDEQLDKIIVSYKEAYKKYITDFPNYYVVLNSVAHLIGMDATDAMIQSVFATNNPHVAFYDIIAKVFKGYPSDEQADFLASLSFNDAYSYFFHALYYLDNGERYQIKIIYDEAVKILQRQQATVKKLKDNGIEVIYGSKRSFLYTQYAKFIGQIYEHDPTKPQTEDVKVRDGNLLILLEAIRQQLTQGKGLLCPFWMKYKLPLCCGGESRELLEKVWKGTEKSSSKHWKRRGCLAEKGCPYRMRVYKRSSSSLPNTSSGRSGTP